MPLPDNAVTALTAEDLAQALEGETLKAANLRLGRALVREKDRVGKLVEAVYTGAMDAMTQYGPMTPVAAPKIDKRKKAEVALWDMGDWQGAKLTPTYNSMVMAERVHRFTRKAQIITEIQRAHHPVNECVLIFGGDMVEGLFNFPTQVFEVDQTIFGQYVTVARLLVEVVRFALVLYTRVTVIAEWGNHGRIGSKRDHVPLADNFDRMCYELARQLLENESRLTWQDCPEDIQHLEVGNYRALVIHGDEIGRTGFAAKKTIVQHVNNWKSGAHEWDFRDVYIHHYHTHGEEPLANGQGAVFFTGSTESSNRYASVNLSASAIPSQRLHFIDIERGRVASQYKVFLDAD